MSVWLLLAVVMAIGVVGLCWWGAGIILHPPLMSRLETFPEQFGIRYEKVSFKTRDGLTLKGWWMPTPHGNGERRTVIMCHGWGDNKGDLLKMTSFLNTEAGLNLLYFDNRSHGESEGEITTIGALETVDFDAAVKFLRENKPEYLERLGVFGLSMGAAVACMSVPAHPEIKALVLESPFSDYRGVVRRWAWINFKLPYFPLPMITLLLLKFRVGDSKVTTYHPIRFAEKISPRPLLVIGGTEDRLMPENDVRRLFAKAGEPKQIWIVHGARHTKCREVAGLEYDTRVSSFFKKNL